jgi:hypothetical protein
MYKYLESATDYNQKTGRLYVFPEVGYIRQPGDPLSNPDYYENMTLWTFIQSNNGLLWGMIDSAVVEDVEKSLNELWKRFIKDVEKFKKHHNPKTKKQADKFLEERAKVPLPLYPSILPTFLINDLKNKD